MLLHIVYKYQFYGIAFGGRDSSVGIGWMSALYYVLVYILLHYINICSSNTRRHGIENLMVRDAGAWERKRKKQIVQMELWLCSDCESPEPWPHSHAPYNTKTPLIVPENHINFDGEKYMANVFTLFLIIWARWIYEFTQTWSPKRRQDIFNL